MCESICVGFFPTSYRSGSSSQQEDPALFGLYENTKNIYTLTCCESVNHFTSLREKFVYVNVKIEICQVAFCRLFFTPRCQFSLVLRLLIFVIIWSVLVTNWSLFWELFYTRPKYIQLCLRCTRCRKNIPPGPPFIYFFKGKYVI